MKDGESDKQRDGAQAAELDSEESETKGGTVRKGISTHTCDRSQGSKFNVHIRWISRGTSNVVSLQTPYQNCLEASVRLMGGSVAFPISPRMVSQYSFGKNWMTKSAMPWMARHDKTDAWIE